jgi:hypothetical protein
MLGKADPVPVLESAKPDEADMLESRKESKPPYRYCKARKEGGRQEWYHSNRYDFAYNRRCYLGTLKGLL